uniref:LCP family protein n=1 Tax=Saccharopolyspora galaxeae TaxID=2781241 RepID=UPI0027DE6269|nr:LCP family protein [Saccharopolyspora sp. HNM0986]
MDDRSRRPGGPPGQPGRPVPPRGPQRQPRPGSGPAGRPAPGGGPRQPSQDRPAPADRPARAQQRPPGEQQRRPEPRPERPAPPPPEDTWNRGRNARRNGMIVGRTFVALLSVLVLAFTGYAWATLRNLNSNLSGSDVIGGGLSEPDGATDILLIGNDSRTDADGNPLPDEILKTLRTTDDEGGDLTDTMILIRIPNGGGRASAMSFPRDTMVQMGNGYGENKLNSALPRAKSDAKQKLQASGVTDPKQLELQSKAEGQKFLIKTLEDLSGVSIDHYAEVNLLGFYEITQAVGGVDVCLKDEVNDSDYSGAVFKAGPQTVAGADALAFVRQRHGLPRGDLDRVVRQQVFMSGLARKILSSGTLSNPAKLTSLMEALKKSVVLDKGWDVVDFAQQMQGIAGGDISFQTIPIELEGESGSEDVTANPREVKQFADGLLLPPQERAAKEQAEQAAEKQRGGTTVNVFNATGKSGLAGQVLSTLSEAGFSQGGSSNSDSMAKSVVYHAPGDEAAAGQVAATLGGLPLQPSGNLQSGNVEVYVGSDYQGPGAQQFAGNKQVQLDGGQRAAAPLHAQQSGSGDAPIDAGGVPCVN